jgi:type I restriction enzyme S subunit
LNDPSAPFNYYNGEIEDCYKVRNGDLLISWSASLGAYIWRRGEAFLNQHIFRVEECSNLVLRDFLFFAVNYIMAEIKKNIHGATMQHITKPEFERTLIPLPPLTIQRSLVLELSERMEEVEKLKMSIGKQLEPIKALPQVILRKAFQGAL